MKIFDTYSRIYFVGIGGIGMSALARFFYSVGRQVAGYDRVQSSVTDALIREGISVVWDDGVAALPPDFRDRSGTLIVYTPAVPDSHPQLQWFRGHGFEVMKRSRVLGMITEGMKSICVAGTHGKTTISTLTAFLLSRCKIGVNAFLGGISKNFNTNFVGNSRSPLVVLEADEFDRSFWQLSPTLGLISSMDADHLDIYGTFEEVKKGFAGFAQRIKPNGYLLLKSGLEIPENLAAGVRTLTYSLGGNADYSAIHIEEIDGYYTFDLKTQEGVLPGFKMGVRGLLNVENAVAALSLALISGAQYEELVDALPQFKGIARRFDMFINNDSLVYIDDYAHHPQEIKATLESVRHLWKGRRVTGVFQPHLFSRTRDFAGAFAEALNEGLDQVVLLPIYPAREEPIPGISSETIAHFMEPNKCHLVEKNELIPVLNRLQPEVLVTMGAGDIDRLVPGICEWGENYCKSKQRI
ncbi:UDP-N-acetylmuramate--L-alanine ligase [Thermophagus sp. OGC60D27]|uniref:UDP-N-acetylmuramate--L-alanine ligase n=1 Tax=Thermophagus sp. OGC60D27 TaxID=3458415 RepID=UPI004037DB48